MEDKPSGSQQCALVAVKVDGTLAHIINIYLKGQYKEDGARFFSEVHGKMMRGNKSHTTERQMLIRYKVKKIATRMAKHWNGCSERLCDLCPWRFSKLTHTKL